jgi:hypothetical protein
VLQASTLPLKDQLETHGSRGGRSLGRLAARISNPIPPLAHVWPAQETVSSSRFQVPERPKCAGRRPTCFRSPSPLSKSTAIYLTADAVQRRYGLTRYLVRRCIEPDARLLSGRAAKFYPVWLQTTIEEYIARQAQGGAAGNVQTAPEAHEAQ